MGGRISHITGVYLFQVPEWATYLDLTPEYEIPNECHVKLEEHAADHADDNCCHSDRTHPGDPFHSIIHYEKNLSCNKQKVNISDINNQSSVIIKVHHLYETVFTGTLILPQTFLYYAYSSLLI